MSKDRTREALLEKALRLQHDFWDALGELETALGIELESTEDLAGHTVETLTEEAGGRS